MFSALTYRLRHWKALLKKKEEQLDKANILYEAMLDPDSKERYSFSSGGAAQSIGNRKLADVRTEIQYLEADIDNLRRKIYGGDIVNHNIRRS